MSEELVVSLKAAFCLQLFRKMSLFITIILHSIQILTDV